MPSKLPGLALALVWLAGCSSGLDCIERVPPEMRADVVRFVVDKGMHPESRIPRAERELGRSQGTLLEHMSEERKAEISKHALGYSHCLRRHQRRN